MNQVGDFLVGRLSGLGGWPANPSSNLIELVEKSEPPFKNNPSLSIRRITRGTRLPEAATK
jgi:hypothetical protein